MAIDADVLMITYNRPEYTAMSLDRLVATCPEGCRIWLWHNGTDAPTLRIVEQFAAHPKVAHFRHSAENKMLREPTNWFWANATGTLLGKVDDDCLMPDGWIERLAAIHCDDPKAGALSCWPFLQDEYREDVAAKKIVVLQGGHKILHNLWVGGSGYLVKRTAVERMGLLNERQSFPMWCIQLARDGWMNGWPVPLLLMDHMDHPRSPNTRVRSESEFQARKSLSARHFAVQSYVENCERIRANALIAQTASTAVWRYVGWTGKLVRLANRLRRGVARLIPARRVRDRA